MKETFVVEVRYGITYTTRTPVPIPDIVASLESLEKLLKRTPPFLEKAYKGIQVVDTKVFVSKIESGSLVEDFIVQYVFQGPENYAQAQALASKILSEGDTMQTIVALGVGALIGYGIFKVIPKGAPSTQITAYNNTIVTIGKEVNLTGEDIIAVLNAVSDKKNLAKEAVSAVKPAKQDPQASIEITGVESVEMPSDVIAEAPSEYTPEIPEEKERPYQNVELVVYASDRDRSESGWAGIAIGIVDKRTPMKLADGVAPDALHGRTRFHADIIVHERYVPSKKKYEAKQIELVSVN